MPSQPPGDAVCPHCGNLLWFNEGTSDVGDPIHRLAKLGAIVEVDDEGQVQVIHFSGRIYGDSIIRHLVKLADVPVIDLRDTAISKVGVARLRRLLPNVTIHH